MSDWNSVAKEFRTAARELRERGLFRAALGRCYYSAFALSSSALRAVGVSMPAGWDGPRHAPLVRGSLFASHFATWWSAPEVGRSIYLIATLYRLRIVADYSPSSEVNKEDADLGFACLLELESLLGKIQEGR